jgi:hypothetical protein
LAEIFQSRLGSRLIQPGRRIEPKVYSMQIHTICFVAVLFLITVMLPPRTLPQSQAPTDETQTLRKLVGQMQTQPSGGRSRNEFSSCRVITQFRRQSSTSGASSGFAMLLMITPVWTDAPS